MDKTKARYAMKEEEWRPVVGWEDFYKISSHGQLKRLACTETYKKAGGQEITRKRKEVLKKPHRVKYWGREYYTYAVYLKSKETRENRQLSHLVAEAFVGVRPTADHEINHIDGNRENNHFSNLEWSTPYENKMHCNHYLKVHKGYKKQVNRGGQEIRYAARIVACGTPVHLGYFSTPKEAQNYYVETYKYFYGITPRVVCLK